MIAAEQIAREAHKIAQRADARAAKAEDRSLDLFEHLGAVKRDLHRCIDSVDACISDVRELRGMRGKLDSISELEAIVSPMKKKEAQRARFWKHARRWGVRVALAVAVGAATVVGGALGVAALHHLGIHVRTPIEVSP
jgi:hypothetical protein